MSQQDKKFPLFFTLEHVDNGYVLTTKDTSGSMMQKNPYRREVVTEDKINARIGQLLHLDSMSKSCPTVFHVEVVSETAYKTDETVTPDALMEAKLAFAHFQRDSNKVSNDTTIALLIEDTQTIEIYGQEAENIARSNNIGITRIGGTSMVRFANTKDGKKLLASYCTRTTLVSVKEENITKWYAEHQPKFEQNQK